VAGIGKSEIPLSAAAIAMGGHVRMGLEDNLYLPAGSHASNPLLVEKIVRIAGRSAIHARADPSDKNRVLNML
jgi:3-keto-5-aminohexanoate cleavage enzyme